VNKLLFQIDAKLVVGLQSHRAQLAATAAVVEEMRQQALVARLRHF
jgi:hypothetical protein